MEPRASGPLASVRSLYRHRALLHVLTARELKARYRGSVLGFFWSLLNPLLMLAVYTLVFQVLFPNRSLSTRPYALFLFAGLLPWTWLSASLTDAASSLIVHGPLLKKVVFPAEVLPAVSVLAQGMHFVLALPVLGAGLLAAALGLLPGAAHPSAALLQVPLLLVVQGVFALGLGLLLAALTVHFRDLRDLLGTALTVWFFASPVLWALADLPDRVRSLLAWNPAAPLFSAWHDALFFGRWISPGRWGLLIAMSGIVFALGAAVFDRLRDSYAEAV